MVFLDNAVRNRRKEGEGCARGTEEVPRSNARTDLEGSDKPTALPVSASVASEPFAVNIKFTSGEARETDRQYYQHISSY